MYFFLEKIRFILMGIRFVLLKRKSWIVLYNKGLKKD